MGYKRGLEEVSKSSDKRRKISRVQNERKFLMKVLRKTEEEWQDSSSDSCTSECGTSSLNATVKKHIGNGVVKPEITACLALDCEMVGVGEHRSSALGRCSVVNYSGEILFDAFVRPDKPVTDYRTKWSGIREADLKEALTFKQARKEVKKLIENCILVGHSVQCDLHALNLFHPRPLIRDTSRYHSIRSLAGLPMNTTPSLKDLSSILLRQNIQDSEHCSIEDARAAMSLYKLCELQWEKELRGELSSDSYLSDLYWPSWTQTGNSS